MRPLSETEGWVFLCLFGAFALSGLLAVFDAVPFWTPLVIWLAAVVLLVRSQVRSNSTRDD